MHEQTERRGEEEPQWAVCRVLGCFTWRSGLIWTCPQNNPLQPVGRTFFILEKYPKVKNPPPASVPLPASATGFSASRESRWNNALPSIPLFRVWPRWLWRVALCAASKTEHLTDSFQAKQLLCSHLSRRTLLPSLGEDVYRSEVASVAPLSPASDTAETCGEKWARVAFVCSP